MNHTKLRSILQALAAALLFGASAPAAKLLLGEIEAVPLAAFLYLGSGLGLLLLKTFSGFQKSKTKVEAGIKKGEMKWLVGAILAGGVAAPIVLMISLKATPASTASLLLNFEAAATTLIAVMVFREAIGKRVWAAVLLITSACILLSWDGSGKWGFSLGALGILLACILWGIDNNFTRNISAKDPYAIVIAKGLGAGVFSLVLSIILRSPLPGFTAAFTTMTLGFFCYGLSIVLFILAMRALGAARTSAFFGTAPFAGAILSFILFRELPGILFLAALPFMLLGAALILGEKHGHHHLHKALQHEHRHRHDDGHHQHIHVGEESVGEHTHLHIHEEINHSHEHSPDIHHRHNHE